MLHGTNFFKLLSTHGILNPSNNSYKFTFKLRWKDTINPNAKQGDTETAKLMKTLNANMPKDYDIIIKWSQEIRIDIDNKGEIIMPDEVNYDARGKRGR